MTKAIKHLFIIVTISIFLGGCGFTTHSAKSLPPELKKVYYQAEHPYEPVEIKLKKRLKSGGVVLLPAPLKSSPIINISSNYTHTTYANLSSVQGRTYTLTYSATISITDFDHKTLIDPQTLSVSRSIALQPNEVFELTPQVGITKQELIDELINKIFFVLDSRRTVEAVKHKFNENQTRTANTTS